MKTLNIIQTLAKICRIISTVVYIVSLVGGIFCIVGIISLALIPDGLQIGGVTIRGLIENNADVSVSACYIMMAKSIVVCAGSAAVSKLAQKYFVNELEAGTPFTFDGAKEMLRLGICNICISAATTIISAIVVAVMKQFMEDTSTTDITNPVSAGLGIMFIILSLICRYGAEVIDEKKEALSQTETKESI